MMSSESGAGGKGTNLPLERPRWLATKDKMAGKGDAQWHLRFVESVTDRDSLLLVLTGKW